MKLIQMKRKNTPHYFLVVIEDNWDLDDIERVLTKRGVQDVDRYYAINSGIRLFDGDLAVKSGDVLELK